ncbi:hypothetical protein [Herbiconiux sp. UC225_62]|uniref:hypothetical protein n=1 Tax=Herbiconiux sp. UC225_62 TaxID=3350168 RepID=UPI0036D3E2E1
MTKQDIDSLTTMLTDMQTHLQGEFDKINERLDTHDAQFESIEGEMSAGFERISTTLDGIVGRLDDDEVERVALSARVTRHEDWIVEAAPRIGVKYTPGA